MTFFYISHSHPPNNHRSDNFVGQINLIIGIASFGQKLNAKCGFSFYSRKKKVNARFSNLFGLSFVFCGKIKSFRCFGLQIWFSVRTQNIGGFLNLRIPSDTIPQVLVVRDFLIGSGSGFSKIFVRDPHDSTSTLIISM